MFEKVIHKFGKSDNEISKKKLISTTQMHNQFHVQLPNLGRTLTQWSSLEVEEVCVVSRLLESKTVEAQIYVEEGFSPLSYYIYEQDVTDRLCITYVLLSFMHVHMYNIVYVQKEKIFFLLFLHVSKSQYVFQFKF